MTDYGTLIMTYLARDPEMLHAAHEIAHAVGVTLPTANKVLKTLARGGLLESNHTAASKGGMYCPACPKTSPWPTSSGRWKGRLG